jgi:hypothetical protein
VACCLAAAAPLERSQEELVWDGEESRGAGFFCSRSTEWLQSPGFKELLLRCCLTHWCVLLCFLDYYSGYHQIALKEKDRIKTGFITPFGIYVYKTISFGLKNAGATYQRAIQMCFANQLHWNVDAYVDDMVIKTRNPEDLIADLEEMFNNLRKFRWKLNPTKCIFGVPSGKLLGFIVSNRGIKANPEKITAITNMETPATIKDVQKITGCMAALNRFIS